MNKIRCIIAAVTIGGLLWLHWMVIPTKGLFGMELSTSQLPENGYALIVLKDGKISNATSISTLEAGWKVVSHFWPFFLAGVFSGLMIGYPLGEYARRQFIIEQAAQEAILLKNEVIASAREIENIALNMVKKARLLNADTRKREKKNTLVEQEIYMMKVTADMELEAAQRFRQRAESLQKELRKARAKIRRLEKSRANRRIDKLTLPFDNL